jgi:HAD superfamily hydrolase (TIGR01662 family)
MKHDIQAIFLDVGNTLRIVAEDELFAAEAREKLMALAVTNDSATEFFRKLNERWKAYRKWSFEHLVEASECELWTRFMLPDCPADQIAPLSGILTRMWRDKDGRRVPRPEVKSTVIELSRRGYVLGIIANTITESEIPDWLESDGLTPFFKTVILSSKVGFRKPGPEIFWEATRSVGVEPSKCAYVGDNPIRDVEGALKAGFALTVILPETGEGEKESLNQEIKPDIIIHELSELLDIFPPR